MVISNSPPSLASSSTCDRTFALNGDDMAKFPSIQLLRDTLCATLTALLLGCSVSQEVIIRHSDGKTSIRNTFIVTDSTIVLPALVVDVKTPDGSYQRQIDTIVLLFSQVKDVTVTLPDATSSDRTLGGVVGFVAGGALGVWAGSSAGFGAKSGGIFSPNGFSNVYSSIAGGGIGAFLGACLGPYIVDKLNLKTIRLDPATPSQRDSLRLFAEHGD